MWRLLPPRKLARRALEDDDAGAGLARGQRGAQPGVAAAEDGDVIPLRARFSSRTLQCLRPAAARPPTANTRIREDITLLDAMESLCIRKGGEGA